jgi:hypothetical protein
LAGVDFFGMNLVSNRAVNRPYQRFFTPVVDPARWQGHAVLAPSRRPTRISRDVTTPLLRRRTGSAAATSTRAPTRLAGAGAVRAARVVLWTLVATAALGGIGAFLKGGETTAAVATADVPTPAGVMGFAELAVRRWLTTPAAPRTGMGSEAGGAAAVAATDAVAARRVGDRSWAVTVAVQLGHSAPSQPPWFFEIGVVESELGLATAGAPAVVPPPVRTDVPVPPTAGVLSGAGDELAATVQAFLDALLCGRGDLARYLAPRVRMAPVAPRFDDVRLLGLATVDEARGRRVVRAEAAADAGGLRLALAYELVLERRGDRWEIAGLSGAPSRPGPPSPPSATSTTAAPAAVPSPAVTSPPVPGA